ncbi:MAG TPA: desulfoferrodoxin FeS4 iron-binding domain-containing protein [Clostridia bacterium]|jgi:desulfoferrodoxin-like iron-binding protein|nr:desulfoferrodoxin FeS4 iron-binding domain-containing protein [Clostridia bacterium]
MKEGEVYVCSICGNKVKVLEEGDGPIVCCGEEMTLA